MMRLIRTIWWLIFPPKIPRERINTLARIKKHFDLKSTTEAKAMIDNNDERLVSLPPKRLEYFGIRVRIPWRIRIQARIRHAKRRAGWD